MVCKDIKKILGEYLENHLPQDLQQQVRAHLGQCPRCAQQAEGHKRSWEILGLYKPPQPLEGYVRRFWVRLAETVPAGSKPAFFFLPKPWALATVALTVVLILGVSIGLKNYSLEKRLSKMSPDDREIVNNMDLARYWQGIERLDALNDMDVIEHSSFEGDT